MAEAVLGTALSIVGAVGVLGQIFDGCVKAYSYFTSAANLGRDSERLVCKIRIEEMRLLVWGREWGVVEGKLEAHLQAESNAGNERLRPLATQILTELYRTITDFNKLQDRYGLRAEEEGSSEGGNGNGALGVGNGEKDPGKKREQSTVGRLRNELHLRAKWVIADKEKFNLFLQDLKDYNDGLERLFPHSRLATLHRTWTNELLQNAERDLRTLNLLETASSGVYPQLNASASLKQLRINLDAKPISSFKPTYAFKIPRSSIAITEAPKRSIESLFKSTGVCQNPGDPQQPILVEWVEYDKNDLDGRLNHVRRIDDLAKMIHSASDRHPDLHTLDCLGYTDDTNLSRYGLVYKTPETSYSTLSSIITSNDHRTPDLGDRFRLAHTLAVALWSLHSLDWLHKSVSSHNVLFFPSAFSNSATRATATGATEPDLSSPYLVGFDVSRPEHLTEMSITPRNSSIDLHRHPESLDGLSKKPYCKSYDIYSLGLVLLEIGLWKPLQGYYKPHYSAEKFRDKVVSAVLVPGLGSKTGGLYREVVERCLNARGDLSGIESGNLLEWVVDTLESLRV